METTSTTQTSPALTLAEAMTVAEIAEQLRATEHRISKRAHDERVPVDERIGAARTAEAVSAARDALSNLLITAEVYAECANAKRAREAF